MVQDRWIGYWRRTLKKDTVIIQVDPFRPLSAVEMEAIEVEAQRYGAYLGMNAVLA